MPNRGRSLHVLFFLRAINFDRVFECFLRELLGRGHQVEVVLDSQKSGLPPDANRLFDALSVEFPAFSYDLLPPRTDWWLRGATALRLTIDYLRYFEPEYEHAEALRARAASRVPRPLRIVVDPPLVRGRRSRYFVLRVLRALEAGLPVSRELSTFIRQRQPDAVLVSPLVGLGSRQGDCLRAAAAEGIPTALPVASWDNLTNKGVIRETPSLTIVWNDRQVEEAVRLHRLPRERVIAVGAHTWDHWFEWQPTTTAEEFARKVNLSPGRPYVLYVCSSGFIAGDETAFVEEWVAGLRASEDERLRMLGVLIRPHPQNVEWWTNVDVTEPGLTAVYPRGGAAPTDAERKADYFDSIFHSRAVMGINTSALAEAAIVGRPVLTLLTERFRGSQEGTLHFSHIAGPDGLLVVGRDRSEHYGQLAAVLERPEDSHDRIDRFVRTFIRPRGLERPAAALAADEIEQVALAASPVPVRNSRVERTAAVCAVLLLQLGGARWLWPGGRLRRRPRLPLARPD